jgi:hypothetical protein
MSEQTTKLYCYKHPNIETQLRCNNCDRPICPKDAVLTPTGYRCRECVRLHQKTFETAEWYDYPLAFGVAAILSYLGSLIGLRLSFFIIFLAPVAGMVVAEAVRLVVRKRRSRMLTLTAAAAAAIGSGLVIFAYLFGPGYFRILPTIYLSVFAFIVTSTVLYRLGGIRIK